MLIQKPLTIMCTNNSLKIPIKFNQHLSYSVSKQKKNVSVTYWISLQCTVSIF